VSNSPPIAGRLAEERQRLGFSQQKLADLCASNRKSIARYERGENVPGGDFLAAFAAAGADVLYILTGRREGQTGERSPSTGPSSHDQAVLMLYHSLSPEAQREIYKSIEEKKLLADLLRQKCV